MSFNPVFISVTGDRLTGIWRVAYTDFSKHTLLCLLWSSVLVQRRDYRYIKETRGTLNVPMSSVRPFFLFCSTVEKHSAYGWRWYGKTHNATTQFFQIDTGTMWAVLDHCHAQAALTKFLDRMIGTGPALASRHTCILKFEAARDKITAHIEKLQNRDLKVKMSTLPGSINSHSDTPIES